MTKQWFLIGMVCIGIMLPVVSCSSVRAGDISITSNFREVTGDGFNTTGVSRFEDDEAGVVCWVYSGGYKGGISCLPIEDTRFGQ